MESFIFHLKTIAVKRNETEQWTTWKTCCVNLNSYNYYYTATKPLNCHPRLQRPTSLNNMCGQNMLAGPGIGGGSGHLADCIHPPSILEVKPSGGMKKQVMDHQATYYAVW